MSPEFCIRVESHSISNYKTFLRVLSSHYHQYFVSKCLGSVLGHNLRPTNSESNWFVHVFETITQMGKKEHGGKETEDTTTG